MKALVVANGRSPVKAQLPADALAGVDVVIAADGGAASARSLGLKPDLVVGDADSLATIDVQTLDAEGVPLQIAPEEKDESDLELALQEAIALGADEIVIIGALDGVRIEHTIANLMLLALPELGRATVRIVDERSTLALVRSGASLEIRGTRGDFVSLFPLAGAARGITTDGMRYPLAGETLETGPSRGLSNELLDARATVTLDDGALLVVHTRRARAETPRAETGGT